MRITLAKPASRFKPRLQPFQPTLRKVTPQGTEIRFLLAALVLLAARIAHSQAMQGMTMLTPSADTLPPLTQAINLLPESTTRPTITLESLLTQALATSPTLARTRAQTTRTQSLARQASLYPNPTIGYQGDQIRGGSFGGGEQGAFIAQTVPLGGKLGLRRQALEAEAQTSEAATMIAQTALRNDLTQAFYATLAAQQSAHIRRQLLIVAQDAVETVHQLANVGQADLPDILATEVEQEQATLADTQAQHVYFARFHLLAALANQPSLAPAPLAGDLTALPPETSLDQILQTSPALAEARAQIVAAQARLTATRREVIPDLQLKAGEQYNFEQLGTGGHPNSVQSGPQSFASAAIAIPLWNRNQGNIAAAEADLEAARQNLRRLQLSIQQQVQPLLETYLAVTQQAALYRTSILPRATRATQLYEQKYNQMAQAYPQVLVSRRTLLDLQLQYTEILATLWRTGSALSNSNLSGSLNSVNEPMSQPSPATIPLE